MDKDEIVTGIYVFIAFLFIYSFLVFSFLGIAQSLDYQYEHYAVLMDENASFVLIALFVLSLFAPAMLNSYVGVEPKSVGIFPKRLRRLNYIISTLAVMLVFLWGLIDTLIKIDNNSATPVTFLGILILGALFLAIIGLAKSRLADMNANPDLAWFIFLPFVNILLILVLFFGRGTVGTNQYGEDPRKKGLPQPPTT